MAVEQMQEMNVFRNFKICSSVKEVTASGAISDPDQEQNPNQLAEHMKALIPGKSEAITGFQPIKDGVNQCFQGSKQGNPGQESNGKSMGGSMRSQPPTPMKRAVTSWDLFNCHPVALQHKIADEMSQHQHDQKIE